MTKDEAKHLTDSNGWSKTTHADNSSVPLIRGAGTTEIDTSETENDDYVRDTLCKIVFYSGWGDNDSYEQCCAKGFETYLMPEQFSDKRPDYKFLGWGVAMNDDVVYYDQDLYKPTECPSYLYGQWKKKDEEEQETEVDEEACIVGYDPFPVVFRDMSDVRSFKTKYWRWDFGDSIIFGCDTSTVDISTLDDPDSLYSRFSLPGDDLVYDRGKNSLINCEPLFKNNIDFFHDNVPKCLMSIDYNDNWNSYHFNSNQLKHFTGINFKSDTESTSGSGFVDYTRYDVEQVVSGQHRFRRIPNDTYAKYVSVTGIDDRILPDQCARISCEQEYDFGNSVAHIYKGPGMYYTTMVCSSENQSPKSAGLQGMELASYVYDSDILPEDKQKIAGCWINVLPVCPCVSGFHVYGTYDKNGSWASDGLAYDSDSRRFLTITNSDFTCDDGDIKSSMGRVGWNCQIEFTDFDGNKRITNCVSGYAPFLQIGASGTVIPRSLPVTGAWFDWSDWNTDYMEKDHRFFGEVIKGWPTWSTKPLNEKGQVDWDAPEETLHNISGDHVYTLPGLYSVGISPEFDRERIRRYMPTVRDYEYCAEDTLKNSASGCCVLVVEIPPKFKQSRGIDWVEPSSMDGKETVVTGIHANVIAGSYPISRIDWDFGDGSKILTISTEGFRVNNKDVINNFGYGTVNYDTELNDVHPMVDDAQHTISNGYLNGNPKRNCNECKMSSEDEFEYPRYPYARLDARDYKIDHKYVRTSVDDHPNGYTIKCSAYAENTNTCVVYEQPVLENGAGLPDFDDEEGFIEMVDIRSDSTTSTNVVLQSHNEDRLYVNRIVDTNNDYVQTGDS